MLLIQRIHRAQEVNLLHIRRRLIGTCVLGLGFLCSSGCSTEYFVDKGHVDWVSGISFEIKPPYLNEKKAFKLRGESLSPWQLQQISEAMPFIAAFTHAQLGNAVSPDVALTLNFKGRKIRELHNLNKETFLAVKTIQNWQITEQHIQFTTDYFYSGPDAHFVYVRDNYIFSRQNQKWVFEKHATAESEGVLVCQKNPKAWLVCAPIK